MTTFEHESRQQVLVLVPTEHGGGAEFVARTWVAALRERLAWDSRLVVYAQTSKVGLQALPQQVMDITRQGPTKHVSRAWALRRLIRSQRPDVLISLLTYSNVLSIAVLATIPREDRPLLLISERNMAKPFARDHGPMQQLLLVIGSRIYRRADIALAISHPVAAEMLSYFNVPLERLVIQPNPAMAKVVDLQRTQRLPIGEGPVTLVVPGRLEVQKRPLMALETARELGRRGRQVSLVFFGSGDLHSVILEGAKEAGLRVDMRGWDEEWFNHCPPESVVLLPSAYEGFGNVLVEAAARGIPCVAAATALGVSDAVVDGMTGILATSNNAAAFADAVEKATQLKAVSGVTEWLTKFSVAESTDRLAAIILDELSGVKRHV